MFAGFLVQYEIGHLSCACRRVSSLTIEIDDTGKSVGEWPSLYSFIATLCKFTLQPV